MQKVRGVVILRMNAHGGSEASRTGQRKSSAARQSQQKTSASSPGALELG